ncbi:TIGR04283 family arsenosugar biosynthesis glycosyltransferase [Halpernia sp. GG3]
MISVVIPTFNEEDQITKTILEVKKRDLAKLVSEIIISDGQSTDKTINLAKMAGANVYLSPKKGRAAQMNFGASQAKNEIIYFLHADSIPPENFSEKILDAFKSNNKSGCFRLEFDYKHWFLKANAWFTKFDVNAIRFGDQSLFVTKEVFLKSGGFNENLLMMEDQEIISRIKKYGMFLVMDGAVITSARKYLDNGIYRMQGIFFKIWFLYYMGYSQEKLLKIYKKLIQNSKL